MRVLLLFALVALALGATPSRANDSDPTLRDFPGAQGTLWKRVPYTDNQGRHTVILTRLGISASRPGSDDPASLCRNGDLYAYDYAHDTTLPRCLWQMHDFVHDCVTSATAEFSSDSPIITDLDSDGRSEIWIVYYIGCRGDVSPVGMKVLMYTGGRRHTLRGQTLVRADGGEQGGTYATDAAFAVAPTPVRQFAAKLWRAHMRR